MLLDALFKPGCSAHSAILSDGYEETFAVCSPVAWETPGCAQPRSGERGKETVITWAYIAGFFDGEGCLTSANTAPSSLGRLRALGYRLTLTQADKRSLEEIQVFLRQAGINAGLGRARPIALPNHKDVYVLWVTSRAAVTALLRKVLPYLLVKKVLVQDVLRFWTLYPDLRPYTSWAKGVRGRTYKKRRQL